MPIIPGFLFADIRGNNKQNKHKQREIRHIRGAEKIFIIKKNVDYLIS